MLASASKTIVVIAIHLDRDLHNAKGTWIAGMASWHFTSWAYDYVCLRRFFDEMRRLRQEQPTFLLLETTLHPQHGILDFQNVPRLFRTECPAKKTF